VVAESVSRKISIRDCDDPVDLVLSRERALCAIELTTILLVLRRATKTISSERISWVTKVDRGIRVRLEERIGNS